MVTSFAELKLSPNVVRSLEAMRITEPTPIQAAVIPDALAGRDVLGKAPTGSGKTFGFGLPLLELVAEAEPRRPRGLVLAPTRELAEQIKRELQPVAVAMERSLVSIYGGVGMGKQIAALRKGVDVVIATPGRLMDLMDQGEVSLDMVDRVVVDEADRMADMGFLPDVRQILDLTAANRQTVMFSATLDKAVEVLTQHYQSDPVTHSHGGDEPDITQMSHRFLRVSQPEKVALAADIIDGHGSTMVFCRTRHGVDRVCRQLKKQGVKAGWIHGGRSQNQRDAALLAFTDGRVHALIATDVAARGIHVDDVACVLHFDPPADAKDYVHRSGRTARAGSRGDVISFVTAEQTKKIRAMQKQVGLDVPIENGSSPSDRSAAVPVTDSELGLQANRPKQTSRGTRGSGKSGRGTQGRPSAKQRPSNRQKGQGRPAADDGPDTQRSPSDAQTPAKKRPGKPMPKRGSGRRSDAESKRKSSKRSGKPRSKYKGGPSGGKSGGRRKNTSRSQNKRG